MYNAYQLTRRGLQSDPSFIEYFNKFIVSEYILKALLIPEVCTPSHFTSFWDKEERGEGKGEWKENGGKNEGGGLERREGE